jgi:hypothetical protein
MAGGMNKAFFASPLDFMKKYAIAPPSSVSGNMGKDQATLDTSGFVPNAVSTHGSQPQSVRYARMEKGCKVAYIDFYKDKKMGGRSGTEQEGIDALRFDASFNANSGGHPIYFLPWDQSSAIVRLSIPQKGTNNPDPDIFFTAAINGCSVFVQGTPSNPTIYHAGGNTGQSDHNEGAKFWREALRKHINSSASAKARGNLVAEVNKTDYVKTPGTVGNSTTPRAQAYEDMLKANLDKAGKFSVTMVNPWGCVMGIRTGADWAFYLQENGTVITSVVTKAGVVVQYFARPMHIRQIYPGGSSVASMQMTIPVKVI